MQHLGEMDSLTASKRGEHNQLGFAIQLCTVRDSFLDDPMDVPAAVMHALAKQLFIESMQDASAYGTREQHWLNAMEIREVYGCVESTDQREVWETQLTDAFVG